MPRELDGYRDELEYISSVLGRKGFYTTYEISVLDCGEPASRSDYFNNLRKVRNRYGITDRGLTASQLARKRCSL